MKWTLRAIFVATLLAFLTAVGAQERSRKQTLCEHKGLIAAYSLEKRDEYTEAEMLEILRKDWEDSLSELFSFASYVDMQRIVRDHYRMFGTNYRVANDDEAIKGRILYEASECWKYGF